MTNGEQEIGFQTKCLLQPKYLKKLVINNNIFRRFVTTDTFRFKTHQHTGCLHCDSAKLQVRGVPQNIVDNFYYFYIGRHIDLKFCDVFNKEFKI